ncbi:MAG: HD domain-containing protein, partial [Thermodesulfovibrionales bacterium]|nr:HD domain-containing protein [Thermodesulfovibrionales bacterium]
MIDGFDNLVKGALLHDIGKLIQRAQDNPFEKTHGRWGYEWLKQFFVDDPYIIASIKHHKKDDDVFNTNFGLIWYESDNLASSERKQEEDDEEGRWDLFTSLASPFLKVRNPNNNLEMLTRIPYLPLQRVNGVESVTFEKPQITRDSYKAILKDLEEDLKITKAYKPY